MTLRSRLIMLLGVLVLLLAGGQFLLIRSLGSELEAELGTAAASVGRSVLALTRPHESWPAGAEEGKPEGEPRFLVRIIERHGATSGPTQGVAEGVEPHLLPTPPGFPGLELQRSERILVLRQGDSERRLELPSQGLEEAVQRFSARLLLGSLLLLGCGLVVASVVAHRVTAPLADLSRAAERLGAGELGAQSPGAGPGETGRAIAAFNRTSERLRELDARERQLRSLEHLGELGEVGRGLAHSLRNPLNALGLTVDELAEQAPEGAALAAEARAQISRIDRSLRAFLALGAADPGVTAATSVEVTAVARDVALEAIQSQSAAGLGQTSPAPVTVEVHEAESPATLLGLEPEIRAILHALVINAVEASPAGEHVEVTVIPQPEGVEVAVEDRGPGLAATVRERLFTPHLTTKPNGAGIGLYLAHRLATTRYGGALELLDRPGGGTRALLRLTARREGAHG